MVLEVLLLLDSHDRVISTRSPIYNKKKLCQNVYCTLYMKIIKVTFLILVILAIYNNTNSDTSHFKEYLYKKYNKIFPTYSKKI
ncbi:hypothetical protein PUN28_013016 [Cardiocondyla obscurior]|uniref:Uncharacterized protein n=1 Tax=Cardiocondyla obscurior TaxID=286306 RepID=A0AAW2F6J3_9HYME